MCVVSFALDEGKFILTFNRDERLLRPTENPAWREINGLSVFCPLDKDAGGTWIGYNSRIAACLQNGALVKHQRKLPYRKSRGLILMEILGDPFYEKLLITEHFSNIEPFTLSIFDFKKNQLHIFRYDGTTLTKEISDLNEPVFLMSSTLYDETAQHAIKKDFRWVNKDPESLFDFHDEHRIGRPKNQFTDLVPTISITQFIIENGHLNYRYLDSLSNTHFKL